MMTGTIIRYIHRCVWISTCIYLLWQRYLHARMQMYLALHTINNMVRPQWSCNRATHLGIPRPMLWIDFQQKKDPMQLQNTLTGNMMLHFFMKLLTCTHILPLSNRLSVGAPHAEHKTAKHSPRKLVLTHTQIASLSRARMPMCNMSDGHRSNTHMQLWAELVCKKTLICTCPWSCLHAPTCLHWAIGYLWQLRSRESKKKR